MVHIREDHVNGPLLIPLVGNGGLARDAEDLVLDINLDVLLGEARKLESGRYEVLLGVLMQIQPVQQRCERRPIRKDAVSSTYLGRMGRAERLAFSLDERATADDGAPEVRALKASSKRRSKSARE